MKKSHTCFVLSIVILILGIIFTVSGVYLKTLPLSSKSALLVFSTAFIIIGVVASAVYYKKYRVSKELLSRNLPIVASWTYSVNSSDTLKTLVKEQKSSTLATTLLILILALIFSFVFAYSGGTYILYLGYIFAVLSVLTFIIAQRFINAYYNHLLQADSEAIFSEDYIYFLDELYPLHKNFYSLEKVNIFVGPEHLLILDYNPYDVNEPDSAYTLTIPIPNNKLPVANYLKHYYADYIEAR